jgi:phosphohistidine phosphatase
MEVYFLRHAKAQSREEWGGDDNERPLTEDGILRMRKEARTLAGLSLGISLIISSPLLRALHTAKIAAEALGLSDSLLTDARLAPGFDAEKLREILIEHAETAALMLVGHEPDFSQTIGVCIGGGRLECKKGALALLDITEPLRPRGSLLWLLPPRILAP